MPLHSLAIQPLFQTPFRPFFLCGTIFSACAILLWVLVNSGLVDFSPYGGVYFWHAHEMIFGFVCAIIVGFLLTAVQNWTGQASSGGSSLVFLTGLWLAARIGALFQWPYVEIYALLDLSFLPAATFFLMRPILNVKQYRNMFFLPLMMLLTAANGLMHYSVVADNPAYFTHGVLLAIWVVIFIMSVMAGRVIPMFTANGTKTKKSENLAWLEAVTLSSTLILLLLYGFNLRELVSVPVLSLILFIAGAAHLYRLLRWKFWLTGSTPLVWSLHCAYAFIPLGMFTTGLMYFFPGLASASTPLHFFTAGAMASLILAMISRVSLGHTGRLLQPHKLTILSFALIIIAGLIRTFGIIILPQWHQAMISISGILWFIAYGLFIVIYAPFLTSARADNK